MSVQSLSNIENLKHISLYTDGACCGNPGHGGWAAILVYGEYKKVLSGGKERTTNNHMELLAVIKGLQELKYRCHVDIYSDSRYVVDSINKGWLNNWKRKGELRGRPNHELWEVLLKLLDMHSTKFIWVRGHADNQYNNECDKLAVAESKKFKQ